MPEQETIDPASLRTWSGLLSARVIDPAVVVEAVVVEGDESLSHQGTGWALFCMSARSLERLP